MKYLNFKYDGTEATVALFGEGRKEAHAYILPESKSVNASVQIKAINNAAIKLAAETGLKPVFKRYLLSDPSNQTIYLPKEEDCAYSVLGQSPLNGTKASLLILLEEDADFTRHEGGVWSDSNGRIWVGDGDDIATGDSLTMTVAYLERMSEMLKQRGASLKDNCLRTWFFVRDIDNNYKGVVQGRNSVFAREGLTSDTHFIASTGIEGQCAQPGRLVAFNAFADTRITPAQVTYLYGRSHLNPTYEYGVAFERATAVDYADRRHVYISGTASIDNKGQIVAPGDIKAQTLRMLENIGVLLDEGGCGWEDVAHMTVYLRDIADHSLVSSMMEERFPGIPKVIVLAPVCRPGWLVETECMAVRKADNPGYGAY
ncbi:MAG: hypothetical protein K2N09_07310 [Muribaculaceae bacterium]|nr:hypothetical protein [Muribaculaceae bacterium]